MDLRTYLATTVAAALALGGAAAAHADPTDAAACGRDGMQLDPSVSAGAASIGMQLEIGYAWRTCRDDGATAFELRTAAMLGTGRLDVRDPMGVDTATAFFGPAVEATWALPGTALRLGPHVSAAVGDGDRLAAGARAKYGMFSLGADVVHARENDYMTGTGVELTAGVSLRSPKQVGTAAGVGIAATLVTFAVLALALHGE
jgi:hypothetical protein